MTVTSTGRDDKRRVRMTHRKNDSDGGYSLPDGQQRHGIADWIEHAYLHGQNFKLTEN